MTGPIPSVAQLIAVQNKLSDLSAVGGTGDLTLSDVLLISWSLGVATAHIERCKPADFSEEPTVDEKEAR